MKPLIRRFGGATGNGSSSERPGAGVPAAIAAQVMHLARRRARHAAT